MNKKDYTKEEFAWVWKDSSREAILNQFYYEHKELRDYIERNEKAIEFIKQHCEIIRFIEDEKYVDKIGRVDGAKVLEILDKKDRK